MANDREAAAGLTKLRATYERMADAAVRRGDTGWRFYDNQGRGFALGEAEGKALRGELQARIDALFRGLDGGSWTMMVPAVLVGLLAVRMAREFTVAGGMPSAIYFVPCLLFLFKDACAEVRFMLALARWREDQAQLLRRRDGRRHEAASPAWMFDPRLPRRAGLGLSALALIGLLIMAGLPPLATLLILLGAGLVGGALLPGSRGTAADRL